MTTTSNRRTGLRSRSGIVGVAAALVGAEALLAFAYLAVSDGWVTEPRYLVYPFVWINAAALAALWVRPADAGVRRRAVAIAVAAGYFLVVAWFGGLVGTGMASTGFDVRWLPPGWGPALLYSGHGLRLTLLPFKVVGYLGLAYLLYAAVLDLAGSPVGALLGTVSCVSCTMPILASVAAGVFGGTTAVASAAYAWSYDLSTVAFVLAVALLTWRPTSGSRVLRRFRG